MALASEQRMLLGLDVGDPFFVGIFVGALVCVFGLLLIAVQVNLFLV